MGLIINKKLQALMAGYPTVSDKYNVSGGILTGTAAVKFGELVKVTATPGYFEKAVNLTDVGEIGGFALATNVKLAENWPGTIVQINPNEAFNLMINGFIAVELDADAVTDNVTPNAKCYVILETGKITTADHAAASTIVELPHCVFTGYKEMQGTKKLAEIYVM